MLRMTLLFMPLLGLSFRASSIQGRSKTPLALPTAIGPTLGDTADTLAHTDGFLGLPAWRCSPEKKQAWH